ncbi:hypothetical protein [Flavobacterium daemonense]|uniref:hypothetical protein n=1 Tax=Flavobacterium daemonense TaxID=1393049 RepID=UPI001185E166|nr:hypothetical protein [Flavobacterium daemonense]KAF2333681.1 hypothetical protein FND99_09415 [Flavobacterium daemonense]
MKKLLFFSAIALLFSIFSCTPDEIETNPKQETKKTISPAKDTFADDGNPSNDGPGDGGTGGSKTPPPTDE